MRLITALVVIYYILSFSLSFSSVSPICDSSTNDFSLLSLSTNQKENEEEYEVNIFDNCIIDKYWTIKQNSYSSINQIFEDELIKRRLLRFDYNTKASNNISIHLDIETTEGQGQGYFTQNNFELNPGDTYDTFIDYQCLKLSKNYYIRFKIVVAMTTITLDHSSHKQSTLSFPIQITKICEHHTISTIDISHLFVVFIVIGIIVACVYESFSSKIEEKIQNKLPEIRNPENLAIISIIIAIVLFFFYMINIIGIWVYIALFILIPLSIAMILEPIFKGTQCKAQMSNRTLEIDYIGSISMFTLIGLVAGFIIFIIWIISKYWIINDIIVAVFAIESIRVFKFTSFKFILFICAMLWFYDLYWFFFHASYFNNKSRLTTQFDLSQPVLILCPEFDKHFFPEYNALGLPDVILPGVIINYLYRFDKKTQYNSKLYFIVSSGAYFFALFLRIYVYCYLYLPVPAFLICFPLMMAIVIVIGIQKGDYKEMMEGFKSTVFVEDELGSRKLSLFAQEAIYDSNDDNMTTEMKVLN